MPLVDLDDPEELRARWCALAAVAHATGFDRRWYADDAGYHHQDETASILRMVRLDGGRSVLFGFHTQHSQTAGSDLLAGSPDWIGQPEVRRLISAGQLGFVYGAFNGTWARASYPGDPWQPADDGFAPIGQWITSDEEAAGEMIEWVAEWADYLGGLDELLPYGVQLIRSPEITADVLGEFFDRFGIDPRSPVQPDLPAGVAAAGDFNLAVGERLADEPDTAEVSVVEDVVIGTSEGPEDEESYVVPPGISPFTGQPIDDSAPYPASAESSGPSAGAPAVESQVASYVQTPYRAEAPARNDEYGVVEKKQGWLRRRKHDDTPPPEPEPAPEAQPGGPAPGTYLPEGDMGGGLPYGALPSSEPPRVGGGMHEGDDFYASLFADAPSAAASQHESPPADEQDWETAEQPAWSDQEATSEYNPFADDPAEGDRDWIGGAWINGKWVEPHTPDHPSHPEHASHPAPQPPPADLQASHAGSQAAHSAFQSSHDDPVSSHPGSQAAHPAFEPPSADPRASRAGAHPAFQPPQADPDASHAGPQAAFEDPHGDPQSSHPGSQAARSASQASHDDPQAWDAGPQAARPAFQEPHAEPQADPSATSDGASAALEDDDAPTAEIAAVLDPTDPPEEDEPSSFTGPSPFAPVAQPEPQHPAASSDQPSPHSTDAPGHPQQPAARSDRHPTGADEPSQQHPAARFGQPTPDRQIHLQQPTAHLDQPSPDHRQPHRQHPTARPEHPHAQPNHDVAPRSEPTSQRTEPTARTDRPARAPDYDSPASARSGRARQHESPASKPQYDTPGAEPSGRASEYDSPASERSGRAPQHESPASKPQYDSPAADLSGRAPQDESPRAEPSGRVPQSGNPAATPDARADGYAAEPSGPPADYETTTGTPDAQFDTRADVPDVAPAAQYDDAEDDLTAEIPVVPDEDPEARIDQESADQFAREQSAQERPAHEQAAFHRPGREQAGAAQGAAEQLGLGPAAPALRVDGSVDPDAEEDEVFGAGPAAKAQVEPHPQPQPWPEPQPRPEPWPQPQPHPAPWPQPDPNREPAPSPHPQPQPEPHPGPQPEPTPGPIPGPDPEPWPEPEPSPQPTPEPTPDPDREPWPEPEPEPAPHPDPEPTPWPDPEPSPQPDPMPRPEPTTTPAARHNPTPAQRQDEPSYNRSATHADDEPTHAGPLPPAAHLTDNPAYGGQHHPAAQLDDGYDGRRDSAAQPEDGAGDDDQRHSTSQSDDEAGYEDQRRSAAQLEDEDGYDERQPAAHEQAARLNGREEWSPGADPLDSEQHPQPGRRQDTPSHSPRSVEQVARFVEPGRSDARGERADGLDQSRAAAAVEHAAGLEGWDGFADDDEPTGFIPMVDVEPGEVEGPETDVPAADVAAAVRMSIPGLGLVGADGPRIAAAPGSIEEAMRAEVERPRPRPQESAAFEALHDWCRARTAIVPSGFTIQVQVLDPAAPSYRFDLEPPEVDDPEFAADKLSGLLGDLWISEASGDQGGWLFARIDAAGRTLRIDRWYDRVPDWWDNPVEARLDVHGLVRRLHDRGPEWQPSYLERLYTTAR